MSNNQLNNIEKLLVFFEVRSLRTRKEALCGYVLHAEGKYVELELGAIGRDWDEWSYIENPKLDSGGILLWEGICQNANYTHPEWEPNFLGSWRNPKAAELCEIMKAQITTAIADLK